MNVVAEKREEKIAIQVETGKSNAVANIQKCLKMEFRKVISAALTKPAKEKILEELKKAGIPRSERVEVLEVREIEDRE